MPRLTKRLVESAIPQANDYFIWDSEVKGVGARIRATGKRVYVFKYRSPDRRQRKVTIGQHGNLTVNEARAISKNAAFEVAQGGDPAAQLESARGAPTMAELCDRYFQEHAQVHKKASSWKNDQRLIDVRIKPAFERRLVNSIQRADIAKLHHRMRDTPYEANRTLALLSKMFNLAELWGLRPDGSNPCRHLKKYKEDMRERFLSPAELARLNEVLLEAERTQTERQSVIAAIRLLILTGCRLSEILTLRWDWVDFEAGCIQLPDSKTGAKIIHLGAPALSVLSSLVRDPDNPHVIVGHKSGSHLVNLQKAWRRIRQEAGLDGVRIHDLRHTFASFGASGNLSLPMIGKMLGHKHVATTQRYAHLAPDPVKQATEVTSQTIAAAMRGESAEVVSLSGSPSAKTGR